LTRTSGGGAEDGIWLEASARRSGKDAAAEAKPRGNREIVKGKDRRATRGVGISALSENL